MAVTVNVLARNGYDLESIPDEIGSRDPSDFSTPGLFVLIGAPGGGHISFLGSGLAYDAENYPTAGTVTGFNIASGPGGIGTRLVEVRGLNISAANLSDAIKQIKDFDNPFAFYGLFAGTGQTITGGPGNDVLAPLSDGLAGSNHSISGGAGNDTIIGGRGADTLDGGAGSDTIQVDPKIPIDSGDKAADGGEGRDTLAFFGGDFVNGLGPVLDLRKTQAQDTGSHGILTLLGFENVNALFSFASNITGNAVGNTIRGSSQADTVRGGQGNDTLQGEAGDDDLFGEAGRDTVQCSSGDDLASGGIANDLLGGQLGRDSLLGEGGFDRLFGGAGIDVLNGGPGGDAMLGGADGDVFAYTAASFGRDVIGDWQDGLDKLRIKRTVADALGDFAIAGNGTTSVTLTLGANGITMNSATAFNIDASDVLFVT